jgi:hypothetical protein
MKVLIDIEDVKIYLKTLSADHDEWWAPVNLMNGSCIQEYLEYAGKKEAAADLNHFIVYEL